MTNNGLRTGKYLFLLLRGPTVGQIQYVYIGYFPVGRKSSFQLDKCQILNVQFQFYGKPFFLFKHSQDL